MTTYWEEKGNDTLILNGVTDENKATLASSIWEALESGTLDSPVKFIDENFVDAEKYSYTHTGFDAYHCWLASSSNILRISGWAEDFQNPVVSEQTAHGEDDLLAFFSSCFTDAGGSSEWALSYYFDGMMGKTATSGGASLVDSPTALKPFETASWNGLKPSICSQSLAGSAEINDHLEYLENLEHAALETSIMKIDTRTKETLADSAHSLTIVGVVVDNTKTGFDRIKALLIADSDNEPCVSSLPESFEEANLVKREKTNSYTLYQAGVLDEKFGFFDYNGYFAQITELTALPFRSEVDLSRFQETASNATCDRLKNGDLFVSFDSLFGSDYKAHEEYALGETITLNFAFMNRNECCQMTQENAGKDVLHNSIVVYRDGKKVGSVTEGEGLVYDLKKPLVRGAAEYGGICLTKTGYFSVPGSYTVQLQLNTNGCSEAYVLNNLKEYHFNIR